MEDMNRRIKEGERKFSIPLYCMMSRPTRFMSFTDAFTMDVRVCVQRMCWKPSTPMSMTMR